MQIIKDIRVIVIILLLLVSTYFLTSPFIFKKSGVIVTSISKDSRCSQIKEGDMITQVGGTIVRSLDDFNRTIATAKSGEYVAMVINNGPGDCIAYRDGDIGLGVTELQSRKLNFGIDIQGGTETTISLDGASADLTRIVQTIEKRVKIFGLPQTYVYTSGNTIKIASLTEERINSLISPGVFKAKIIQDVILENSTGAIKIGNRLYNIESLDGKIVVDGIEYSSGQAFILDDIKFDFLNATNTSIAVEANIFTNGDISKVLTGYERYNQGFRNYEFYIPIEISRNASDRFAKVSKGLKSSVTESQILLQGQLAYYLDNDAISKLSIPYEMTTKEINSISIVGFGSNLNQVANQKNEILAALKTEELPPTLRISGTAQIEPKYKMAVIFVSISFAIILAAFTIAASTLRYKSIKFGGYALLMISAGIFIIFGVAALTQTFYYPGWIIDMQTISGLVAIASLNSAQLLLVTEKITKNKNISLNYKYKEIISLPMLLNILVFVVSFLSLFTTWKGFGLSLLVGLVIEVALTRSVYENILKI